MSRASLPRSLPRSSLPAFFVEAGVAHIRTHGPQFPGGVSTHVPPARAPEKAGGRWIQGKATYRRQEKADNGLEC